MAASDLVKASDEDLTWLFPGKDPIDVARGWATAGPVLVVVTRGADGSVMVRDDRVIEIPGRQVPVADTIGAGDTFTSALIDALLTLGAYGPHARHALQTLGEDRLAEVSAWAATAAAITVSRHGADPPRLDELVAHAGLNPHPVFTRSENRR